MKLFKTIVVFFIILFVLIIPLAIFLIKFGNNSSFSKYVKGEVIKYPGLALFLNLNEPGDGRFLYLGPHHQQIRINIYSVNNTRVNESVTDWMNEIVSETTGKKIVVSDLRPVEYKNNGLLGDNDLNNIRKIIVTEAGSVSDLNIVYTSSYSQKPSSIGLVIHRDTIFVFEDALKKLSEKSDIKNILEKTTIMHEWGHLLGIDHVYNDDCIMSEIVEVYDDPTYGKMLPTKYCWEELHTINNMKQQIL
jgi:hypothetical protein